MYAPGLGSGVSSDSDVSCAIVRGLRLRPLRTTHQFQAHTEPSDPGSVQQPEEELTHEATAQQETAARPPIPLVTEPPAASAVLQQALPANSLEVEPHPPTSTVPPAAAPTVDTTTPVKARPPLPTALPCAQPAPPTEPKAPEPSFHHPQPKVYHMDKNKQTHWLQPSDDEMDPTASASTGQLLPPATHPVRPPGSDLWWVVDPITNPARTSWRSSRVTCWLAEAIESRRVHTPMPSQVQVCPPNRHNAQNCVLDSPTR